MLSVVFPLVFLMFPLTFVYLFPYVCSPVLLSDSFCYSSILLGYCNRFQRVTTSGPRCGDPRAVSLPLVPTAHCTVSHVN